MAEVTITGAADEMSSAVQSVADAEKQRREEQEKADRERELEYQKQEQEIVVEIPEEDTPDMAEEFDFAAAFKQLGDTLSAKLDELKPQPSDDEVRTSRLAQLREELAALGEPDPAASSGSGQPETPPKKTPKKATPSNADSGGDTGDHLTEDGKNKKKRGLWW